MESNIDKKEISLTIGLITVTFTAIPFFAYWIAYSYESSHLEFYGIPTTLVQIDLSSIFQPVVLIIIILMIILTGIVISTPYLERSKKSILKYPLINWFFASTVTSTILVYLQPAGNIWQIVLFIYLILGIVLFILEFISPIIEFRTFRNYKNNLMSLRNKKKKNSFSSLDKNKYFKTFTLLIILLFITYLLAKSLAKISAGNTLPVFKYKESNYALIRINSNGILAVKYEGKMIKPGEIIYIKTNNLDLSTKYLMISTPSPFKIPSINFKPIKNIKLY